MPVWPDPFPKGQVCTEEVLKRVLLVSHLRPRSHSGSTTPYSESDSLNPTSVDCTALLSNELLLKVLARFAAERQLISNTLVCRRWSALCGRLVRSIRLLDWEFLESGRLSYQFPNLVEIDIVPACVRSYRNNLGALLNNRLIEIRLTSGMLEDECVFVRKQDVLDSRRIDEGVRILVEGCRNLGRTVVMNVSAEGLSFFAKECELLQEIELHYWGDSALRRLNHCQNLQILRLVGSIPGIYESVVSDIGMTFLAQGCRRLVKLELVGCEGSYDGIKAIGQCCLMLEELTLCNHKMKGGWLSALSYCENLKTLRIQSCKNIDEEPGPVEHLGSCMMLE